MIKSLNVYDTNKALWTVHLDDDTSLIHLV